MTYKGISRIPPLSPKETILFYTTGRMPERFKGNFEADRTEILRQHGVIDADNRDGGFYYAEDKK